MTALWYGTWPSSPLCFPSISSTAIFLASWGSSISMWAFLTCFLFWAISFSFLEILCGLSSGLCFNYVLGLWRLYWYLILLRNLVCFSHNRLILWGLFANLDILFKVWIKDTEPMYFDLSNTSTENKYEFVLKSKCRASPFCFFVTTALWQFMLDFLDWFLTLQFRPVWIPCWLLFLTNALGIHNLTRCGLKILGH